MHFRSYRATRQNIYRPIRWGVVARKPYIARSVLGEEMIKCICPEGTAGIIVAIEACVPAFGPPLNRAQRIQEEQRDTKAIAEKFQSLRTCQYSAVPARSGCEIDKEHE